MLIGWKSSYSQIPDSGFIKLSTIWAKKVANSINDSLTLDSTQFNKILQINLDLNLKRSVIRKNNVNDIKKVTRLIQEVENTRDSSYMKIFSKKQFLKYLDIKDILISN